MAHFLLVGIMTGLLLAECGLFLDPFYFSGLQLIYHLRWRSFIRKGSPTEKDAGSIRALPKWGGGGGLNACQDGLGHLFWEELSMFKGAFACFWEPATLHRIPIEKENWKLFLFKRKSFNLWAGPGNLPYPLIFPNQTSVPPFFFPSQKI